VGIDSQRCGGNRGLAYDRDRTRHGRNDCHPGSQGPKRVARLFNELFSVHAVAAATEPPGDQGGQVTVDAFFDIMQFVSRYDFIAFDTEARCG
jgi:hypothetical protein